MLTRNIRSPNLVGVQENGAGNHVCRSCRMLNQGEHAVAYCYQCALEAKRLASREHDPKTKEEYLERMRRWVEIAESYEFADRLAMLANSDDDGSSG